MVSNRIIIDRAVADRVDSFDYMSGFIEVLPLPLNKLAVGRIDRCKPAAPVD